LGYITIQGGAPLLVEFTDSDWVDDPHDRKTTVGYVFSLGSRPVTWAYKKQQGYCTFFNRSRVPSNGKCKLGSLVASTDPFRVWIPAQHLTSLWCDNQSAIKLAKDPIQHQFKQTHRATHALHQKFHS
jgi:hypothetical protein